MPVYGPAQFATSLATSGGALLPYVAVAVTSGLVLLAVFLGIRTGIRFFRGASYVPLPTGYDTYIEGPGGSNPSPD